MLLRRTLLLMALGLSLLGFTACSPSPSAETATTTSPTPSDVVAASPGDTDGAIASAPSPSGDLSRLFAKVWRVTDAPYTPASGSINIFLPNGTLLQTSCVETYVISTWTADRQIPNRLQVTESGRPAYDAEILELTDTTLRLRRNLIPSNETQEITYTAVEEEFLCPDLPR